MRSRRRRVPLQLAVLRTSSRLDRRAGRGRAEPPPSTAGQEPTRPRRRRLPQHQHISPAVRPLQAGRRRRPRRYERYSYFRRHLLCRKKSMKIHLCNIHNSRSVPREKAADSLSVLTPSLLPHCWLDDGNDILPAKVCFSFSEVLL